MIIALAFAAAAALAVPPVTVTVQAASSIPRAEITAALDEAAAIWRKANVAIAWEIDQAPPGAVLTAHGSLPFGPLLRVAFDDGPSTVHDYVGVLGWIMFEGGTTPLPEIHLSHSNAVDMLRAAYGDVGVNRMTTFETRTLIARALGRALAHELGHYLLASKQHTERGLMKARQSTGELFGPQRALEITAAQQSAALSRLSQSGQLASR